MKKYAGGTTVKEGVYLHLGTAEFQQCEGETCTLPGEKTDQYIKVPGPVAVIAGPVFGLVFIITLPLVGILAFFGFLAHKMGLTQTKFGHRVFQPLLSDRD
jgi:hypothetical protein